MKYSTTIFFSDVLGDFQELYEWLNQISGGVLDGKSIKNRL